MTYLIVYLLLSSFQRTQLDIALAILYVIKVCNVPKMATCTSCTLFALKECKMTKNILIVLKNSHIMYHDDTKPSLTVWRPSGTHFSPD